MRPIRRFPLKWWTEKEVKRFAILKSDAVPIQVPFNTCENPYWARVLKTILGPPFLIKKTVANGLTDAEARKGKF